MRYSELTRRYFEATPAVGVLLGGSVSADAAGSTPHMSAPHVSTLHAGTLRVFRGSAGQRERGTWAQFDLEVQGAGVLRARFLAFGCPHTIAVASWVAEQATGSELRAALPQSVQALRAHFEVPQEKLGRLFIVEDAWLAACRAAIDSRV